MDKTDTATMDGFVHAHVSPEATSVTTDEAPGYRFLSRTYKHGVVRHRDGEYVRDEFSTNRIEGVWAQLKRQIIGVHHWVSPKHLNRYVGEMTYRMNRREMARGTRVNDLLAHADAGHLSYKVLTA